MPWITLNGEHYTDSQLIIEFLSQYVSSVMCAMTGILINLYDNMFSNNLHRKYDIKTPTEIDLTLAGAATMARIMMDEHFFWFDRNFRIVLILNVISMSY